MFFTRLTVINGLCQTKLAVSYRNNISFMVLTNDNEWHIITTDAYLNIIMHNKYTRPLNIESTEAKVDVEDMAVFRYPHEYQFNMKATIKKIFRDIEFYKESKEESLAKMHIFNEKNRNFEYNERSTVISKSEILRIKTND